MGEKEFNLCDHEVITMVNRGRGPGGELPGHAIHYVPEDRSDRICELDSRIQELKRVWPVLIRLVACLAIVIAIVGGWVHPVIGGCMGIVHLLQLIFAWRKNSEDKVDSAE